jgi:rubrerythrin
MRDPISRRGFFAAAGVTIAAGSAAAMVGCGKGGDATVRETDVDAAADLAILNDLLALELTAIDAYSTAIPLFKGAMEAAGRRFLVHEQEHANGLTEAIKQLGATTDARATKLDHPRLRDQRDALGLAISLEEAAIAAYVDTVPKLSSADLRATVAQIATSDAEHLAVLRQALGKEPVPQPLVRGDPQALAGVA